MLTGGLLLWGVTPPAAVYDMDMNFDRIADIFRSTGEGLLLEHQVYRLLREAGLNTPEFCFVPKEQTISEADLSLLPSENVILKIVSPWIVHKSDVSGIRIVPRNKKSVQAAIDAMIQDVPAAFQAWNRDFAGQENPYVFSLDEIREKIQGVLVCEKVDYERHGLGSEILMGIRASREFGPVVTMGLGGLDVEYLTTRLKEGGAISIGAAHLLEREDIGPLLEPLAFFDKMVRAFRGRAPLVEVETLVDVYECFSKLAVHFSPYRQEGEFVIEEAEVNPFVIRSGRLIALDGLCRISHRLQPVKTRPYSGIARLLKPESIGIIGVSGSMNLGHIILNNVLKNGFPAESVTVIKPGKGRIEGCQCVSSIENMPAPVDMFILSVSADQSEEVMRALVEHEKAHSVIIIAGGIGEKKGTKSLEKNIKELLENGRKLGRLTPIVNGGNCLGIFSRPGHYDTTFVPDYKLYALPRKKAHKEKLAFISQSGAFMISRMSKFPHIEPMYAVSIGNQIDLTLSDYLNYFKDEDEVTIFAVYIEGFLPGDGLAFVRAVRELTRQGKTVLVYKAGRSVEGRAASASHTASVAGDYAVNRAVLQQAGAIVAEDIFEFETTIKILVFLADKTVRGRRAGLISNAGFECVIMSDNMTNGERLELGRFSLETEKRLREIMQPLGIDKLQDIHNPVDITPVADDEAFCLAVEALLDDPGIDCAVVSPLPMSPAMQTLAPGKHHSENLYREGSTPKRLIELFYKTDKPLVVSIDTGEIYQPMVDLLEENRIPVFRHSDDAVRFLRKYVNRSLPAGWREHE